MAPDDLPAVVRIHRAAFPNAAMTLLGEETLRRYYVWLSGPAHDVVPLAASCDGELAGFCVGGTFRGADRGFVTRNVLFLTAAVARRPGLWRSTRHRTRVWSAARLLRREVAARFQPRAPVPVPASAPPAVRSFGIQVIAASPAYQRRGVGRALMAAAEQEARARGYGAMHLGVDRDNARAIAFYESLGWHRVMRPGGWKGEMACALDARS